MKTLLYCALLALFFSCTDKVAPEPDTVLDEYPDWYTLKAPVDRQIEGVWGSYEKTLLISTGFIIFRSTDKGQNWRQVFDFSLWVPGVVQYRDTLFTMSGLSNSYDGKTYTQKLVTAYHYSVDDGQTWQQYRRANRAFDIDRSTFLINPITAANGTTYKINQVFTDRPTATSGSFETPGAITSDGHRVDLPQLHQLKSLYLDPQQRLYLVGSDAVCKQGTGSSFCNSKQGRGVVYISKKPLP